mgnify:CR=1 FL=1|jgi:Predicted transcriptional regulator|nr:hypothetical protein [Paenibacillus cisolokensis]
MSKSTNMLSILWMLRAGRRMTAQQLADELEIHIHSLLKYVPYFLLPYGRSLTVLEPDILIDRLANICEEMAVHYHSSSRPNDGTAGARYDGPGLRGLDREGRGAARLSLNEAMRSFTRLTCHKAAGGIAPVAQLEPFSPYF